MKLHTVLVITGKFSYDFATGKFPGHLLEYNSSAFAIPRVFKKISFRSLTKFFFDASVIGLKTDRMFGHDRGNHTT